MNQKGFSAILILAGILLIAGITGGAYFFGKSSVTISTPPAALISPTPQTTKVDETAGWKTYTNSKYNYSVKYPTDYSVSEVSPDYVRFSQGEKNPSLPERTTYLSIQLDTNPKSSVNSSIIYKTTSDGKTLRISKIMMDIDNSQIPVVESVFNQILSTFKFLSATTPGEDQNLITPTPDQTSCTTVNDCGVNTCGCKAVRKEFLGENMCMMACAGELKCLNNKCVLDDRVY